jgi:pimeloyl-ACP methyl ester carboxylesterase
MIEERFRSFDGLNIFMRSWRPAGASRGVVVIVHGFNSHSAYYLWVAEQLIGMRLSVYALDLRGRGRSDGERFLCRKLFRLCQRRRCSGETGKIARPRLARFPAWPQRRRRCFLHLCARSSVRAVGTHLRKLRIPATGPRFCPCRPQGPEPYRPACPRFEASQRGLLP